MSHLSELTIEAAAAASWDRLVGQRSPEGTRTYALVGASNPACTRKHREMVETIMKCGFDPLSALRTVQKNPRYEWGDVPDDGKFLRALAEFLRDWCHQNRVGG